MTMFSLGTPPGSAIPVYRTLLAVDIAGFSHNRSDANQAWTRKMLYALIEEAFTSAELPWDRSHREDRGDGLLIVAPPEVSPSLLIDPFYHRLATGLRRHNLMSSPGTRIQLRVAVHVGEVFFDAHGVAGNALIHLFRLLDASAFKQAHTSSEADAGLVVSDRFYNDVLRHGLTSMDPSDFHPIAVKVKETKARAWIYMMDMPGSSSGILANRSGRSATRGKQTGTRAGHRADTRRAAAGRTAGDATPRRPGYAAGNPTTTAVRRSPDASVAPHARPDWHADGRDRYVPPARPGEPVRADGRRHCGPLERVLHRQWDTSAPPPAEVVQAIDRLAGLSAAVKEELAAKLEGIFVGPGGVPELDDMGHLRGVPLPAGWATWDVCAGAYSARKIIVGTQPSPTPDVTCHEIGHALDDMETANQWLSDQAEFRRLYDQCVPHLVSDFHRQPSGLGRRELFADAFAAIGSRQRPALVDMLGGNTRAALNIMLYFNWRFGI